MNQRTFSIIGTDGQRIIITQMGVEYATILLDAATNSYRITFHLMSGKTVSAAGYTKGEAREVEGFLEGRRFAR